MAQNYDVEVGPIDGDLWHKYTDNFELQRDEILALNSFYENTENFWVVQEATQDSQKLNSLQFKVQIETRVSDVCVEIWVPVEVVVVENELASDGDGSVIAKPNPTPKAYLLERSVSGRQEHVQIKCEFLPPLILSVVLPVQYPSNDKPIFTLSCFWLNKSQLSALCLELDRIWLENREMPVVFTWVQWLQEQTLNFLNIFKEPNTIMVTPVASLFDRNADDKRAINEFNDVQKCIYDFLRYNYIQDVLSFKKSMHTCSICFDEKFGRDFIRIDNCKHVFCVDCLSEYVNMHVTEGTVQMLKCAEKGCNSELSEEIMGMVLNKEQYNRWQRLLLQFTLDTMEDIIYCPKCSLPIVVEDDHAYCMKCNNDFCKMCKDTWHIGKCVTDMEKIEKKMKNLKVTADDLQNMTEDEIKKAFKNADHVIMLRKKASELIPSNEQAFILKYKPCPKCKARIDKYEGCGTILCYVCGKSISGYEHFNTTTCKLWDVGGAYADILNRVPQRELHPEQEAINIILQFRPDQQRNTAHCPTCGQVCLKLQSNNHLKCWLCKTNFCYNCKAKINGVITAHFRFSKCKQHSE